MSLYSHPEPSLTVWCGRRVRTRHRIHLGPCDFPLRSSFIRIRHPPPPILRHRSPPSLPHVVFDSAGCPLLPPPRSSRDSRGGRSCQCRQGQRHDLPLSPSLAHRPVDPPPQLCRRGRPGRRGEQSCPLWTEDVLGVAHRSEQVPPGSQLLEPRVGQDLRTPYRLDQCKRTRLPRIDGLSTARWSEGVCKM